jgi:hypothetical protein
MARISLAGHWKFRRLVRALAGLEPAVLTTAEPVARGILELLWEAGYNAVSDYVGSPADLADAVGWRRDPDVLVTLLADAGFLEARGDAYVIHDLWPNAPRFAQFRWLAKHPGQAPPWKPSTSSEPSSELNSELSSERNAEPSAALKSAVPSPVQSRPGTGQSSAAGASRPPTNGTKAPPTVQQLVPLGYELVRLGQRFDCEATLKDALKTLAARYGIPYDATSITGALDALKHAKAPLLERPTP